MWSPWPAAATATLSASVLGNGVPWTLLLKKNNFRFTLSWKMRKFANCEGRGKSVPTTFLTSDTPCKFRGFSKPASGIDTIHLKDS